MKAEPRFLTESGTEIFTGNELLVKGALETEGGVHLLGGYPGSPTAGFFDTLPMIKELLGEKGIRTVINNNEALAAAMLNGTQTLPARAMIVMKSIGVHVAADALALGNMAGAHREGGAIVCYGDDPWSDSTQVAADSRFISKHLFIPVIEPSNPQEVKDFVDLSFKISRRSELFVGYVITTNLADGGGTVTCKQNQYPTLNVLNKLDLATSRIDLDKRVLLPPRTWWQEESLSPRFQTAIKVTRELGVNRIEFPAPQGERRPIGFVAAGLGHDYLRQALCEMGLDGEFPILKLGMSYPVDPQLVEELAHQAHRIVVVEERRGFMEEQIAEIVLRARQRVSSRPGGQKSPLSDVELWGKTFPDGQAGIPETRGLHPSILIVLLRRLLNSCGATTAFPANGGHKQTERIEREVERINSTERVEVTKLPPRMASFCPGCPHRDSASLCLQIKRKFMDPHYMKVHHGRGAVDLLFHGDTGCYTMLMFPPNNDLMHDYSGMGLGGGTGVGIDPFVTNKEVVFMGDGTFFHSGQIAISQAIYLRQDITFIILDNSTTAMTGHQPNPGVDYDILGNPTPNQDIETFVRGMASGGEVAVYRVNPEKREQYRELLETTFLADGVKVVIADKECGITRTRRKRREERTITRQTGYLPSKEYMNTNPDICRFCLACTEIVGCPGLRHVQTDYGLKVDTDPSWCVADGACERIGACDAFERIIVRRKRPPRPKVPQLGLDEIPEPRKRPGGDIWRACLTGVGGMGIGLATNILVRAGHKEGYEVIFLDKKGLAIRNGGVVSQVVYNISHQPVTAIIPYGKADLLLGMDILEAARTLDPAGRTRVAEKEKTAAVINTDKIATIAGLMGRDDYDTTELEELIRANTREEDFLGRNISRICEKYLGGKLYANVMMLGFAFQKGLIPVSMHSMAWAIKDAIKVDFRKNLYAFNMGRKLVERPDLFQGPPQRVGWKETLEEKSRYTQRRYGKNSPLADQLRELLSGAMEEVRGLDEGLKRDIVIRTYDAMRWGGIEYARRYVDQVLGVYRKDRPEYDYAATGAVVWNLASAMLIKDCIFKAELSTSKEKYRHDQEKYNINRANGDRVLYRRLWNRQFHLGRWTFQWNFTPRDWQLKTLKRMRWVRWLLWPFSKVDRRFRRDYEKAVGGFDYASDDEYRRELAKLSSPMCMTCVSPSCIQVGCPIASDIPTWMRLGEQGRWKAAFRQLQEKNNFPEFTAYLCPGFCEQACKRSLNRYPVRVRDMERRIVEQAFAKGWIKPQPSRTKTGRKVAVVGSGPAGLAAAQQLARAGHDVTVFEKDPLPGGLLRFGIPEFHLEKKLVNRRIKQLEDEGVRFRCGLQVGADVPAGQLRTDFDAICLATGAAKPRDLTIPGREKEGIIFAMDFLRSQGLREAGENAPIISAKDKIVAVIGGGLSGEDCVETALRDGAKQVHQLEILPEAQTASPPLPNETPQNLQRHWKVSTKAFVGTDGRLGGLSVKRVKYTPSARGAICEEVSESEFQIPADLAIVAMGFDPVPDGNITEQLALETDSSGKVLVNENYATNVEGVFAAGDFVTGASYVATAINSAREAAEQIDAYLAK